MKLKCLVVDDEPLAIELLQRHIALLPDLELVAGCENAIAASSVLNKEKVDVLFLDIQMPVIKGIDFIQTLAYRPKIILTTAYKEYAYEAFQLEVVDYLLKPITFDRFLLAVNKVLQTPLFSESHRAPKVEFDVAFVYLNIGKRSVKIDLKDILYIESLKDYIRVVTEGKQYVAHHRISMIEQRLPEAYFMRVHRSYIVSTIHVDAFSNQGLELQNKFIPIGRNYKEQVMAKLNSKKL